jgi:hypothetical protein
MITLLLLACGGGGVDPRTESANFSVNTIAASGTTISPTSLSVLSGQTASFTVGLQPGYSNLVVTGGGGTLNGSRYITGSITANTTVSVSAMFGDNVAAQPQSQSATFAVTAIAATGTTITPSSAIVQNGQTISFTVGLVAGYSNLTVTGGGGVLNGSRYVTGPITANTTVLSSATISQFRVKANVLGGGGTINPTEITVAADGSANFKLALASGYKIAGTVGVINARTFLSPDLVMLSNINGDSDFSVKVEPIVESIEKYAPEDIQISPSAIFSDEFTATQVKFTLRSKYAAINRLTITAEPYSNSPPANKVQLYDDGTHGDEVAGDGIFTALYTPNSVPVMNFFANKVGVLSFLIVARNASGVEVPTADFNYSYSLVAIDRSNSLALTRHSATEYSTSHFVNFVWPGISSRYRWDRTSVTRRLLASFPDVFDLVTIRLAGSSAPGEAAQNFVGVKNSVHGIGLPIYTDSMATYGSAGKLNGVIYMNGQNGIALLHEIGHMTCSYLNDTRLQLSDGFGHMITPSTLIGQNNFSPYIVEQSNGDFLSAPNLISRGTYLDPYSKLELYLMGLVGPTEVTPERFVLDRTLPMIWGSVYPRAKTTLVTINDLVSVYGARNPSMTNTSKTLRMAFVVLSERAMFPAEIAMEHTYAKWAESKPEGALALQNPPTYWYATGGRGALVTALPPRIQ